MKKTMPGVPLHPLLYVSPGMRLKPLIQEGVLSVEWL